MIKNITRLFWVISSVLFLASHFSFVISSADAATGIHKQINFQGKLVGSDGTNVADNTYSVVFTLYDAASGGINLWDETQNVTTTDGIFQVSLGSVDTTLGNVDFNSDNLFLGIKVGADSEMTPRVRFSAVPYAFNAEKVSGLTVTNTTGTFTLANAKTLAVNNSLTFAGTDGTTLTFQGTDTYVGRATTDTLTNKTLTAARLADGGFLADSSGNELLVFDSNATAVNQLTLTNAATGNGLTFSATGDDANVALSIVTKAAGALTLDSGTTGAINIGTGANAKAITIGNNDASTTLALTGGNDWSVSVAGAATFASMTGVGLTSCDSSTSKLLWNAASGLFSCGTDMGSNLQVSSFTDTTTEVASFIAAADIWDGTYPNITPGATSSKILVSVNIRGTSEDANDHNPVFTIRRAIGANPICSDTQVGGEFVGGFLTTTTQDWGASVTFADAPSSTGNVRYTVCTATTGLDDANTDDVRVVLTEIGSSSAGGGGSSLAVRETDASPEVSAVTALEFGPAATSSDEFIVTDEGSNTARIRLGDQVGILSQAETVTGGWIFNTAATTFTSALQANGGITTSTADQDLSFSVNGAGDILVTVDEDSSVGIGNTDPQATLDVTGKNGTNAVTKVLGDTSFASLHVENTGAGDIFTASSSGTTRLSILQNGGLRVNGLTAASCDVKADTTGLIFCGTDATSGGGGSQTPWTSDIDGDGFDLTDLSNVLFRETTGAPTGTDVGLYRDNSGDLNVNVLTSKALNIQVNGTDEYNFSSTAFTLGINNIVTGATTLASTELDRLDGKDASLVDQNDFTSGDGAGGTSSGSGFEAGTGGIGLLQGCSDGQVLKWTESTSVWGCAADTSGSSTSKFVVKGSNENVASGTTLQSDNDLTFAVGASETWVFDFVLRVTNVNSATPDWKAAILGASGWTCSITMSGTEPLGAAFPQATGTDCDNAPTAVVNNTILADVNIPFQVNVRGSITTNSAGSVTLQWAANTSGSLTVMAGSYVTAQKVGGSDLAEIYYTSDDMIGPGDVVSLDSSLLAGVKKTSKAYDPQAVGIISTKPGLLLGDETSSYEGRAVQLALSGRVPVKVSTESGAIVPGDYLTSSSLPGVAMKATKAGSIIGQAMTGYEGEEVGIVTAFIKNGFGQGTGNAALAEQFMQGVQNGGTPIALSEIITDRVVAGLEVITPRIIADEIVARIIRAEQIEGLEMLVSGILNQESVVMGTASAVIENEYKIASSPAAPRNDNVVLNSLSVDGLATISSTLRVQENGLIEGILTVIDTLMTKNLVVNGLATFFGEVIFKGNVAFVTPPTFSKDTAGFATIRKGSDSVEVVFDKEYEQVPVVQAGISLESGIRNQESSEEELQKEKEFEQNVLGSDIAYIVTKRTVRGFMILLKQPATEDVIFSWTAFAVDDPSTFESRDVTSFSPSPTVIVPTPNPAGDLDPQDSPEEREEVSKHESVAE